MVKKLIISVLFLINSFFSHCSVNIDSLFREIEKITEDTVKIQNLNQAFSNELYRDPVIAAQIAYKQLFISGNTGITELLGDAYLNIGLSLDFQNLFDSAIFNYYAAVDNYEKANNIEGIANSELNLGIVYYFQENYPEALSHYTKSLELKRKINDEKGIASLYNNIAKFYQ